MLLLYFLGSVWLGNPLDITKRVEIPGLTREMLSAAENAGTTPEALAVQLLTAIFTDEELQTGNCTKPRIV